MRIKSGVLYWLAGGNFAIGLLYSIGIEGTCQTGGTVSDGAFITAMVLILLAILFMRLGFAAKDAEDKAAKRPYGRIDRTHARPQAPEYRQNRRDA